MFLTLKNLLIFLFLFFTSCTHLSEKIDEIPYYTSKSDVLDKLGRPFQIKRMRGLDFWIYKFKRGGREYVRAVIFKEGHFLKSKKKKPYPDPKILLDESENFEEYKKAIKFIKKNRKKRN